MQTHLLSLNSPPSIFDSSSSSSIIGSIHTCIVLRTIGSSLAVRIPSLKQYGIISSTHLTDETYDDIQQIVNSFKSGQKLQ
jgi:hypothetical protein